MNEKHSEPPKLEGYYYSYEEAKKARNSGKILSIRIETSRKCNLECRYCCNNSGEALNNEISYEKIIDIINQAKDLGTESIVVIGGGEPTIYPKFREIIRKIYNLDMTPLVFTNTQTMDKELARFLFEHDTTVITKLDSLDEKTQDKMVGVKGAHKKIMSGIKNLLEVGYAELSERGINKLGASFVINKTNKDDISDIWRFCRENDIVPNLEMMVPNGRGENLEDKLLTTEEWNNLKNKLLDIDEKEFNFSWFPYSPLIGMGCFQALYNIYISVDGKTRPCSSIHCNVANVKDMSLKEIIETPFFKVARNIEEHLKGKCGRCPHHSKCIGCRGLAFSMNEDGKEIERICREDPSCPLEI